MEPGVQVRELGTGSLGVIERGNNAGGYYVNFGSRKNWKRPNELEIVGSSGSSSPSVPTKTSEEPNKLSFGGRQFSKPSGANTPMNKYSTLPSKAYFEASSVPQRQTAESMQKMMQQQSAPAAPAPAPVKKASPPPALTKQLSFQQQQQSQPQTLPPKPAPAPVQQSAPPPLAVVHQPAQKVVQAAPVAPIHLSAVPQQAAASVSPRPPATPTSSSNQRDMFHIEFKELELGDVIGSGKYGEVSQGYWLGTPVAIKRILECSEETNIMIDRELQILKEVRHPNIVQFLGATKHNGEIYIITEFMNKGDLFDALIFGDETLSWKVKLGIALDIAQACTYLQARGILHRDLKSQNILLSDNMRAKLCDLGLARVFEDQANKRLTFVGSDRWMAPEIFMGVDYDYKVDVFSYGIVLVELITNAVPDERKPQKMFAFEAQAFLSKVPSDCPPAFAKLTVACTSTDPKSRPSFTKILEIVKALYDSLPDDDEAE